MVGDILLPYVGKLLARKAREKEEKPYLYFIINHLL